MVKLICRTSGYFEDSEVFTGSLEDALKEAKEKYFLFDGEVKQLREDKGVIAGDYFLQIKE